MLALLFVVLLTALVVDFTYEMHVAAAFVENHSSDLEAYIAAKSAVAAGLALLSTDLFGELQTATQQSNIQQGQASGDLFDSYEDIWAEGIAMTPFNDAVMQCTIDDEYGKINLNALVIDDGSGQEQILEPLSRMLDRIFLDRDMEESPVPAILDWLDSDDDITEPNGAEFDYYSSLENPYGCKNGPMDSIQELLLIPGITPEIFFGDPEQEIPPLSDLLTVHGHPQGKINMNTADFFVLYAYFAEITQDPEPVLKAEDVLLLIEDQGPFTAIDQRLFEVFQVTSPGGRPPRTGTRPPPPPTDPQQNFLEISSSCFRIHGDGQSEGARVRVEAYVYRDTMGDGTAQTFRMLDWRVYR